MSHRPAGPRPRRSRRALSIVAAAGIILSGLVAVTPAAAVTDTNPEFHLNRGDLEFILKQITIAESHAGGASLVCASRSDVSGTCVPDPKLPWGLRTVDGSLNNLHGAEVEKFGAGGEFFPRLVEPRFRDAEPIPVDGMGGAPGTPTSYAQTSGFVYDSEPRVVSNLIVDQTTDNPAAIAAAGNVPGSSVEAPGAGTPGNIFIPNVSPDEGLSAPFNSWFTLFGQFFDHGLDLVSKGGNGTVVVPLQPDDPLYVPGGDTNFIMLTRATQSSDGNGQIQHVNRTTPFVDQNQTYTSHPSHQVFLREYEETPAGPLPTGALLNGADADGDGEGDGMATWADVKAQAAAVLGIALDDMDVLNVPLVATDPYGRFIAGPNGYPQLVTLVDPGAGDTPENRILVEGDPSALVDATDALKANHAFLDDIAHTASPNAAGTHDGALLDAHFITGDGRGNENIGLTSVHHVFHSEHNRLVRHINDVLVGFDDADFLARWQDDSGVWDYGERLFQAARFTTEMEYQHLAFEEFGRFVSPNIDNQPLNETAYHADINPAITAEFAHVVYRFGHSMLTETVARDGFGTTDLPLLDAFLNPGAFTNGGTLTPDQGAAAVIQGMVAQTGNGIDEFVIPTLRNNLLGLPLDLATLNMARARDTGSPTLQEARQTLWEATADGALKPYANWADFRLALRHRASIVNFIAAYGIHPTLETATSIVEKREAAALLLADDAFMFLPADQSGLNDVDFWIGGLAEDGLIFGGLLGTTFNAVFETQLENLQNADRFYYLTRTQGLNLIGQLENNSFSELVLRNTDADNLPANLFQNPDQTINLGALPDPWPAGLVFLNGEWRYDAADHVTIHGTPGGESIRGGKGDDSVWGHDGDDRIEGDQGNDTLQGGAGNDILTDLFGDDTIHGGGGHDAINSGSGFDLVFGNTGRDFVLHGNEPTTSFAGAGDDFVKGGNANDVVTGNEGDDWLEGALGHDLVQGDNALTFRTDPNGGADVLFGGSGNDDHDAEGGDDIMLNNGIDRHDGMLGFDWVTHKNDPFAADSDMDISVFQPPSVTLLRARFIDVEGLSGWSRNDVLRGRSDRGDLFNPFGAGHELTQTNLDRIAGLRALLGGGAEPPHAGPFMVPDVANDILLGGAGSDLIEGRSGDDFIDGDAWLDVYLNGPGGDRQENMQGYQARIFSGLIRPDQISIVREVVTAPNQDAVIDTAEYADVYANYTVTENGDGTWTVAHVSGSGGTGVLETGIDTLRNIERLLFADQAVDLVATANDPATGIVELSTLAPVEDQVITATRAFDDAQGVQVGTIDYTWQWADDAGAWTSSVNGTGTTFAPGDVEVGRPLRVIATFLDGSGAMETISSAVTAPVVNVNDAPTGPVLNTATPTIGAAVTATDLVDNDGLVDVALAYEWQAGDGTTFTAIPDAVGASFTVTDAQAGARLRVVVSYTDNHGTAEVAVSLATEPVPEPAPVEPATAGAAPGALTFPAQEVGTTAAGQAITVSSTGGVLTIASIGVTGAGAAAFATTNDCTSIADGATCTISVTFAPTAPGTHAGMLTVQHDGVGGTSTVTLTGSGTAAPVVEPPPPATSPIVRYIERVYGHLFNRAPDPAGLAGWTSALASGTPRIAVANAITASSEYRSGLITGSYQTYLGRDPEPAGLAAWLSAMNSGLTISQMEAGFIASNEYYAQGGSTDAGWVTKLYADVLGRTAGSEEVAGWTAALGSGTSRTSVAMGFLHSDEHLTTVINGYYLALLGRDLDPTGQAGWVNAIQTGTRLEVIIGSIIASDEYYNLP